MAKNLNKVRTIHRVGKIIYFNNIIERDNFIYMYEDLFGTYKYNGYEGELCLYLTINKNDFDEIVRVLNLEVINRGRYKSRYWSFNGAKAV